MMCSESERLVVVLRFFWKENKTKAKQPQNRMQTTLFSASDPPLFINSKYMWHANIFIYLQHIKMHLSEQSGNAQSMQIPSSKCDESNKWFKKSDKKW